MIFIESAVLQMRRIFSKNANLGDIIPEVNIVLTRLGELMLDAHERSIIEYNVVLPEAARLRCDLGGHENLFRIERLRRIEVLGMRTPIFWNLLRKHHNAFENLKNR